MFAKAKNDFSGILLTRKTNFVEEGVTRWGSNPAKSLIGRSIRWKIRPYLSLIRHFWPRIRHCRRDGYRPVL